VRNFASIFDSSPLKRYGFEMEQHIGNLNFYLERQSLTFVLTDTFRPSLH